MYPYVSSAHSGGSHRRDGAAQTIRLGDLEKKDLLSTFLFKKSFINTFFDQPN